MADGSLGSRKNIRFNPETNTIQALIDPDPDGKGFHPKYTGLVINESFGGCGLATISDIPIIKNDILRIKIGDSGVTKMKVCWRRDLDGEVIRLGLKYL